MEYSRQADYYKSFWWRRKEWWRVALVMLSTVNIMMVTRPALCHRAGMYVGAKRKLLQLNFWSKEIYRTSFKFHFNNFTNLVCTQMLGFSENDIFRIVKFVGRQEKKTKTSYNGYIFTLLLTKYEHRIVGATWNCCFEISHLRLLKFSAKI